ncbi:hypothetical protein [Amycolatopsis sp.]|uniref:hypothetical protein n=1 Tax=Amycolatopsis sp. TaxID=37632 RepID=UPI002B6426E3|nr:hypothetical protein [Amycolatopsis sp.]HVV11380.1 hypothetical protein [Amycolatopsis sp.]
MAKHRIDDESNRGRWGGPELLAQDTGRPAGRHRGGHDRGNGQAGGGATAATAAEIPAARHG